MAVIKAPVEDFSGVVANVEFTDGAGESDDPTALAYFQRHGYDVTEKKAPAKKAAPKPSEK